MVDLAQFGVVAGELAAHTGESYPKPVQGRVVHIDADFLAYQVSAESKDELDPARPDVPRKSLEDMFHNASMAAEHTMRLAGGTKYVCHVTPTGSTKGGRPEQAIQQEYQANRKSRDNKPEFLDEVRAYIGRELNGAVHMSQEADDGLAQALYEADDPKLVVVASKDKDLRMVPGLHYDFDSNRVINAEPYGYIELDDSKSSKKVVGWGSKFFWAQMLMGDTADNIKGLPVVHGGVCMDLKPTKAYEKLLHKWVEFPAKSDWTEVHAKEYAKLEAQIEAAKSKHKLCGPVITLDILDGIKSDAEAFKLVKDLYTKAHGINPFVHWRTGQARTATQVMLSEMQLLWMRRNDNKLDAIEWIKEKL
tara:strand:+ start:8479 stop:9567 length:1089 start_codon:yes stop_codon:yes gene_type:complete